MNHDIYNRNAANHAERTAPDKLPPEFFETLRMFTSSVSNGPILDVGCGVGRDLRLMDDTDGMDVFSVGLDAAENMVKRGVEETDPNAPIDYVCATATDLPFPDGSFSGIWCPATVFLLEFDQMRAAIREIHRVANEDAIVALGFKLGDEQSDETGYQTRERWGEEVTYYFVDKPLAHSLCEDAGFSVVKTSSNTFDGTVFYTLFLSV